MIENFITSSCVISNNTVYKNGQSLFVNKAEDTGGFLVSAYQHFSINYPKYYKMDNMCRLGLLSAELLLKDFKKREYNPSEVGVVLSNASASLDTDIKYYKTTDDIASPALFVYTLPNIVIGEICIRHHFKGENAFFITEKFDPDFTVQYVNS